MISHYFLRPKRNSWIGVWLSWGVIGSVLPGQAQQTAPPPVELIKLPVHLHLGATTVGKLAAEIGDQIGLKIETEPMLSGHRIVVQMNDISAETALKTLADLNGWEITHPRPGHYRISQIPARLPNQIAEISEAFRMALPMDFRRYLGIEAAKADIPQAPPQGQKFNDARLSYLQEKETARQITSRHQQLVDFATTSLTQALSPRLRDGKEHAYDMLSAEQKDNIFTLLVIMKLDLLNPDLLQGKLKPFQRDWKTAELTLKDGATLMIGATTQLNGGKLHEAFGAPIQALQTPPASKP